MAILSDESVHVVGIKLVIKCHVQSVDYITDTLYICSSAGNNSQSSDIVRPNFENVWLVSL